MEQQAKERLTGGVILVVMLVLLVPELLTGPRPAPQPVPAQPDQAQMRSYTMDLGESAHTNSGPVAASTAVPQASEPVARTPAPSAPVPVPVPAQILPPTQSQTPSSAVIAPHPARRTEAPAVLAPPVSAPDHGAAGWSVQLATFSSRENAARLVASLKSRGFGASIAESTHGSRKLYRVRVGAERDKAAAQKLLARLKAAGQKGGEIVPR